MVESNILFQASDMFVLALCVDKIHSVDLM